MSYTFCLHRQLKIIFLNVYLRINLSRDTHGNFRQTEHITMHIVACIIISLQVRIK